MSEAFKVLTEVRQGEVMSPLQFYPNSVGCPKECEINRLDLGNKNRIG